VDDNGNKPKLYSSVAAELPFIRPIYRTLFSRRRTYAAFDRTQLATLLEKLAPTGPVLDPMSGYGILAEVCRPQGIATCSIELNPPSYLWQILLSPDNKDGLTAAIHALENSYHHIKSKKEVESSDSWFPKESERILSQLWEKALPILEKSYRKDYAEDMLSAILLPFLGRLSSYSAGVINIQVKKGGVIFYRDWSIDFKKYIYIMKEQIQKTNTQSKVQHTILFGNVLDDIVVDKKFSYMVTSPPYPNMRDYYAFFFPENYALENIFRITRFNNINIRSNMIGGTIVSEFKKKNTINHDALSSEYVKKFLTDLRLWKGEKHSMYDNISYYIPYYYSYFLHLERAYKNIEKMLSHNFDCFIVVVNNTARKFTIPVDKFIEETWTNLGCQIPKDETLTTERAHVGSINPRVVGFKARHTEYAIRITRNAS